MEEIYYSNLFYHLNQNLYKIYSFKINMYNEANYINIIELYHIIYFKSNNSNQYYSLIHKDNEAIYFLLNEECTEYIQKNKFTLDYYYSEIMEKKNISNHICYLFTDKSIIYNKELQSFISENITKLYDILSKIYGIKNEYYILSVKDNNNNTNVILGITDDSENIEYIKEDYNKIYKLQYNKESLEIIFVRKIKNHQYYKLSQIYSKYEDQLDEYKENITKHINFDSWFIDSKINIKDYTFWYGIYNSKDMNKYKIIFENEDVEYIKNIFFINVMCKK